mgnify:CR=1 FL=1
MPKAAIFKLYGNTHLIDEVHLDDAYVPSLGDIVHVPEHSYQGNDCYAVVDIHYSIKEGKCILEVSLLAESSNHRGITGIREQIMVSGAWEQMLYCMTPSPSSTTNEHPFNEDLSGNPLMEDDLSDYPLKDDH